MESKETAPLNNSPNDVSNYAKQIRKDYYKSWRNNNKDKVKKYNSKNWQKRAEKLKLNSYNTK